MPARNSYVLFVLFFSLTAIACNKAQRTPMRESSIEEMLEPAPDHGREAIASGEASTSEAQECLPLHRHIYMSQPPKATIPNRLYRRIMVISGE